MKRINFDAIERRVINKDQVAKEIGNHYCKSLREICAKYPVEFHIFAYGIENHVSYQLEFWLHNLAIAKFPLNKLYCPSMDKSYYDTARRIIGTIYVPEFKVGDIIDIQEIVNSIYSKQIILHNND